MSNLDETQKDKNKIEMQKFIDTKIIELNKTERISILSMIIVKVPDTLIIEKNSGTIIRYSNIPYELLCDIYNLIKKNITDKADKLNNV